MVVIPDLIDLVPRIGIRMNDGNGKVIGTLWAGLECNKPQAA
jgi:hypothetical protein